MRPELPLLRRKGKLHPVLMVLLAIIAPWVWAQPVVAEASVRRDVPQPPELAAPVPEWGSWAFARNEAPVDTGDSGEIAGTIADLIVEQRMLQTTAGWINVPLRWVESNFTPRSAYGRTLLADFRQRFERGFVPLVAALREYEHLEPSLRQSGLRLPVITETEKRYPAYANGIFEYLLKPYADIDCWVDEGEPAACHLVIRLTRTAAGRLDLLGIELERKNDALLRSTVEKAGN